MKRSRLLQCTAVASACFLSAYADRIAQPRPVKPTPQQLAFMDMEIGAFFHFGLNVFTGQEHGDGFEPASKFNPTDLDMDQWIRTAKAMGAKYAVITARHEGGFCLWPTKTTDYSIANSPYKNGKGDLVKEFVEACRKYGIKPGVYHTASHDAYHTYKPQDRGKVKWGRPEPSCTRFEEKTQEEREHYIQVQEEQMRELLSNYGKIYYVWCDHWNAAATTDEDIAYTQVVNEAFRRTTQVMRELQPDCLMMGPDTWVPGNEKGMVVYPLWNAVNTKDGTVWSRPAPTAADASSKNNYGLLETTALTGHPFGKFWRSRECTTNTGFHHGGWFWHPDHIKKTLARTLAEHLNLYYRTVGLGANTIINLPPDNRGRIPDDIAKSAEVFGAELRRRFAHPVFQCLEVKTGNSIEYAWEKPQKINTIVTMENIANGQKIAKYRFEALVAGKWVPLEPQNKLLGWKPYNSNPGFDTIDHKKIDRVKPVVTNRIRFQCLESFLGTAEIRSIAVFECAPLNQRSDG